MLTGMEMEAVTTAKKGKHNSKAVTPSPVSGADTATVAKPAAAAKVFAVTELLEAILLNLPLRNIFGVRRVSRKWDAVIEDSKALQQKTFNRKAWDVNEATDDITSKTQLNELVRQVIGMRRKPQTRTTPGWNYPKASWRDLSLFAPPARHFWWETPNKRYADYSSTASQTDPEYSLRTLEE